MRFVLGCSGNIGTFDTIQNQRSSGALLLALAMPITAQVEMMTRLVVSTASLQPWHQEALRRLTGLKNINP